jgi:hypothetical protein
MLVLTSCAVLAACAAPTTYNLGSVTNAQGQNRETMTSDWNACRDKAHAQANSGMSGAKTALLGASVVGYQAGVQNEIDTERAAFKTCMESRGYAYTAPRN